MQREINRKKTAGVFIIVLIVTTFVFVLKCLITTIGTTDELYYITTAYRFYQGDAMLADDWNTAQMSGFLLLPFVSLYMAIMKTTEGIVLYFRFLYLIYKMFVAFFCLKRLKPYGLFGMMGVAVFYFFTPYNLDSLSYNTIPIGMVMMIGAVYLTEKRKKLDYYLCGIFLAMSILAQPFFILIYFAGAAFAAWKAYTRNSGGKWHPLKKYVLVSAGAVTVLLIFLLFIFSRASLHEISENLQFILNDKNHSVSGTGGAKAFCLSLLKQDITF
ncbi:MAG: hypothetical protein NC313_06915 [Butyrivibrio sp.]|nr:hypothetical protein [Butyrivibrio sp.]